MGLLKKKPDETQDAAAIDSTAAVAVEDAVAPADEAAADLAASVAPDAADAATADAAAEAPEGAGEAEAAPEDASDALLSMFHSTDEGSGDREMLLQMAGEVELPDLVDQLRTVAAALAISGRRPG